MYSTWTHWVIDPLPPVFGIPSPTESSSPRMSSSTRKNSPRYHLPSPSLLSPPHLGTPFPSNGQRELPRSMSTSSTYPRSSLSLMRRCDTNGPKSATLHLQQAHLVEVLHPRSPRWFSTPSGYLDPQIRGSLKKRFPTTLNTSLPPTLKAPRAHPPTRNSPQLPSLPPSPLLPRLPSLSLKGMSHQTLSQSMTRKRT